MTLTLAGVLSDATTVLNNFGGYIAIGIAVPLGLLIGRYIKKMIVKR